MQNSLKYLCAQFVYDWTKNKEMVKVAVRGGGPMTPNLFNLQHAQPL